jgi:hypothetical protein
MGNQFHYQATVLKISQLAGADPGLRTRPALTVIVHVEQNGFPPIESKNHSRCRHLRTQISSLEVRSGFQNTQLQRKLRNNYYDWSFFWARSLTFGDFEI